MIYIFDTSPLSVLFRNYYQRRFPSFWSRFRETTRSGHALSTREVRRELEDGPVKQPVADWDKKYPTFFSIPTAKEGQFVRRIFAVSHFQQIIERKQIATGGKNADPFVIAKAFVEKGTVVTLEKPSQHGVKIPDVCNHFSIPCISLEEFMEVEDLVLEIGPKSES